MLNLNLLSKKLSISLELQELLPLIAGCANHYVFIKNHESVYQYANDPFIRLMGFNRLNKIISLSDSDLCEDKGLVEQYRTDDRYVLEEEKKLSIKAIVLPQYNPNNSLLVDTPSLFFEQLIANDFDYVALFEGEGQKQFLSK